jgi:hypothetical protein
MTYAAFIDLLTWQEISERKPLIPKQVSIVATRASEGDAAIAFFDSKDGPWFFWQKVGPVTCGNVIILGDSSASQIHSLISEA